MPPKNSSDSLSLGSILGTGGEVGKQMRHCSVRCERTLIPQDSFVDINELRSHPSHFIVISQGFFLLPKACESRSTAKHNSHQVTTKGIQASSGAIHKLPGRVRYSPPVKCFHVLGRKRKACCAILNSFVEFSEPQKALGAVTQDRGPVFCWQILLQTSAIVLDCIFQLSFAIGVIS